MTFLWDFHNIAVHSETSCGLEAGQPCQNLLMGRCSSEPCDNTAVTNESYYYYYFQYLIFNRN